MSKDGEKEARLPVKQLAILSICRFAEPLALTGVFPYLPEMIESFGVASNDVAKWAGVTSLAFSGAQALTSIQWGRASDRFGRKPTILVALFCAMSTSLLFGFSQNLPMAIVVRAMAGASNGNVGILRTTVAELVPQKSLQPIAFSIMPMIWAIGSSCGPSLGGMLAVPTRQYPALFAGNAFFEKFKFALPNIVASVFFTIGLVSGFLFLKETLETKRHKKDYGLVLGKALTRGCKGERIKLPRSPRVDQESVPTSHRLARKHSLKLEAPPGWKEVFSRQSSLNILSYTILAFHAVTFDQLVPVFLHLPHVDHNSGSQAFIPPFKFGGGFGLETGRIGLLFTLMGVVGIVAQFAIFPPVARRYGSLRCFQVVTFVFPMLYILLPYCVLLPTDDLRQTAVFILMFFKAILSTFAFPCTTILLTNSALSLRILGTLNGVAVATSAIGRAFGPLIGGATMTLGADTNYVILPWFLLGVFGVIGWVSTLWLEEMDGPTASKAAVQDEDEAQLEEQIVLLPNDDESNAGQATGVIMDGQDGQQNAELDNSQQADANMTDEEENVNETSPLLRAFSTGRPIDRGDRLNIGATSMTRQDVEAESSGKAKSY